MFEERGAAPRAGTTVAFRVTPRGIAPLIPFGDTEAVLTLGIFEVWRTRSFYAWDVAAKARTIVPATYRIVKRLGPGVYPVGGVDFKCEYAFVMRCVPAGDDWRSVFEMLSEQVVLLSLYEMPRRHRRKNGA